MINVHHNKVFLHLQLLAPHLSPVKQFFHSDFISDLTGFINKDTFSNISVWNNVNSLWSILIRWDKNYERKLKCFNARFRKILNNLRDFSKFFFSSQVMVKLNWCYLYIMFYFYRNFPIVQLLGLNFSQILHLNPKNKYWIWNFFE